MEKAKFIPVIQLYLSLLSVFIPFDFFPAGDMVGYSMVTCVAYWCMFTDRFIRDCIIGLFAMNFVSCFKGLLNYEEWRLFYDITIFCAAHIRLIRYVR